MSIGKRIEFLRMRHGLNQEDIARLLKIDRSTVSKIEKDQRKVWARDLKTLADRFNIHPGWFFEEDATPTEDNRDIHKEIIEKLNLIISRMESPASDLISDGVIQFPQKRRRQPRRLKYIEQPVGAGRTLGDCPVTGEFTALSRGNPTHGFLVKGKSMEPEVPDGSLLMVKALGFKQDSSWKDGDLCIIYLADEEEWTLKKVLKYDNRYVMLMGADGKREKRELSRIRIQGVVQDVVHSKEHIDQILDTLQDETDDKDENYRGFSKEMETVAKRKEKSVLMQDTGTTYRDGTIKPSSIERVGNLEDSKTEKKLDQIIELMRIQVGLLEEVKKNAEQNEVLSAVNYLLERGEISAQEAEGRLKKAGINMKKFLK